MIKKCILILLDGIGDRSFHRFRNQTPLQAAETPCLDALAAGGANGLYHAGKIGQALPSENAHFALFGYDPDDFPGRGALEALGANIPLGQTDVALLSHFVSLEEKAGHLFLRENKPVADTDEIQSLAASLQPVAIHDFCIQFIPTGGIRGVLLMKGNGTRYITDSDPFKSRCPLVDIQPWQAFRDDPATLRTARVLKAYLIRTFRKLSGHLVNQVRREQGLPPLNGLNTQRAGQIGKRLSFTDRYGLKGLVLASGLVYHGLGDYLGMDVIQVADSDNPGLDMAERIDLAIRNLDQYDLIHIHTKTPDEAAHTKSPNRKKKVIESLDAGIGRAVKPLLDNPEVLVIVTADHSTPSAGPLIHSGECVPLTLSGAGVRRDGVNRFNEVDAAGGVLGTLRGKELILTILNHLDRSKLQGIMDTPMDQPFWPGNYAPFTVND